MRLSILKGISQRTIHGSITLSHFFDMLVVSLVLCIFLIPKSTRSWFIEIELAGVQIIITPDFPYPQVESLQLD